MAASLSQSVLTVSCKVCVRSIQTQHELLVSVRQFRYSCADANSHPGAYDCDWVD